MPRPWTKAFKNVSRWSIVSERTKYEFVVLNEPQVNFRVIVGVGALVGTWLTVQEMAGFSVTLMKLDDTLQALLDHPRRTPALVVGAFEKSDVSARSRKAVKAAESTAAAPEKPRELLTEGDVTPTIFRAMMHTVGEQIIA